MILHFQILQGTRIGIEHGFIQLSVGIFAQLDCLLNIKVYSQYL